jgi:hydrogenase/urease accessory protein HupE
MTPPDRRRALVAGAALLAPASAHAHLVNSGLGPFYDGVSHLALTPEDLLPAVALALLAGQRGAGSGRATLLALPAAWLLGGIGGMAWPAATSAGWPGTVSLVVLGGLVAAEARVPPAVVVVLAAVLGLFHGYLNGSAMVQARLGALGLAGIVVTLAAAVTLGAALVVAMRVPWGRIAVRVAGSWIAAIGLLALGWSLRRG